MTLYYCIFEKIFHCLSIISSVKCSISQGLFLNVNHRLVAGTYWGHCIPRLERALDSDKQRKAISYAGFKFWQFGGTKDDLSSPQKVPFIILICWSVTRISICKTFCKSQFKAILWVSENYCPSLISSSTGKDMHGLFIIK